MAWFRRKDGSGAARDPKLPLTVAQAQRLRTLVQDSWARRGREVAVHSDHVVDADGGTFGLWNLAVLVADEPQRQWSRLVDAHVARLATPKPSVASLSDSQLLEQVVLRLVRTAALPDPAGFPTTPTLAGDVRIVLVVDFPEVVITPPERELAARGDLDDWRAVGRGNLWHMMRSVPRTRRAIGDEDRGGFEVLASDSVYTASMALFLPELLSMAGRADLGRGVLVALPFRHQVAFRVIDGPRAGPSIEGLFRYALTLYDGTAGPLSPHVFWVRDGCWEQITSLDGEHARILVSEDLARALA